MQSDVIWPEAILEYVNAMLTAVDDILTEGNTSKDILRNELCSKVLPKYLSGEDFILSEDEFSQAYTLAAIETSLQRLTGEGIVKCVENENGEMVYFLSEKGKVISQELESDDILRPFTSFNSN
jgi:hypothetical protein